MSTAKLFQAWKLVIDMVKNSFSPFTLPKVSVTFTNFYIGAMIIRIPSSLLQKIPRSSFKYTERFIISVTIAEFLDQRYIKVKRKLFKHFPLPLGSAFSDTKTISSRYSMDINTMEARVTRRKETHSEQKQLRSISSLLFTSVSETPECARKSPNPTNPGLK